MSIKQKILIISGLTGVGKSDLAIKVAKVLKTDIIVGDSLQIYKNFPIASNFPNFDPKNENPKYHFLGIYDVLKQRISAFQYKEILAQKIQEIISQRKTPLIEGGCGFYLHYSLSSSDAFVENSKLKDAEKKAQEIIEKQFNKDWTKSEEYLIKLCPNAVNYVPHNDYYRLEKALKYAIASNGEFFRARDESNVEKMQEMYDVRGIFLTKNEMEIYQDIHKRCDLMVERGYIEEVYQFIKTLDSSKILESYNSMPVPLGYKEAEEFIKNLKKIGEKRNNEDSVKKKLIKELLLEFATKFQIKSRQYAHYQIKYARKKFNNFLWINNTKPHEIIIKEIVDSFELSREEFDQKINSNQNLQLIGTYNNHKETRFIKSSPLTHNYDKAFQKLNSGLFPSLGISLSKNDL